MREVGDMDLASFTSACRAVSRIAEREAKAFEEKPSKDSGFGPGPSPRPPKAPAPKMTKAQANTKSAFDFLSKIKVGR